MVHSFPTRRSSDLIDRDDSSLFYANNLRDSSSGFTRSEEHTSELQSHHPISYAVFCLKKKKTFTEGCNAPRIALSALTVSSGVAMNCSRDSTYFPFLPLPSFLYFFFNDTATTEIYTGWYTLSLHDALPISLRASPMQLTPRIDPVRPVN